MVETKPGTNLLFLRDEDLRQGIELLFFAYRDFTAEADTILAKQKFGRAHHRVIYFVGQYPGMSVRDLLDILSITKQSLSRVLRQLVDEGYIDQQPGTTDRRQRLLTLTTKGKELEGLLTSEQRARIAAAYKNAGADAVEGFRKVMLGIMEGSARRRFNEDKT
ncbi:MAG: MarR family transcriptional regulator [Rhodospirillaceae bacterium]|jgi:DNA-binding MarR family transcriptional regulator|nr:MarR family transcriptional regulator [Rhodospirillaceae bacterium]MBT5241136.1 MarR family transcriptional regulator [Rhodospirillaceae bacterium]MBT5565648.1 MarR family transcriptional regulator [Rhodospirillaceae bacterium]MBT6090854.1 MarR family transcriptional regulator [Rhodospirillaceae bacterium]MBT6960514.1 MarR family transcriptional regulator [Rhodospirillaceae bacterium]